MTPSDSSHSTANSRTHTHTHTHLNHVCRWWCELLVPLPLVCILHGGGRMPIACRRRRRCCCRWRRHARGGCRLPLTRVIRFVPDSLDCESEEAQVRVRACMRACVCVLEEGRVAVSEPNKHRRNKTKTPLIKETELGNCACQPLPH